MKISSRKPFEKRVYIEEESNEFDTRLINLKIKGTIYLDGLWQDERYFKDIEDIIRKDFTIHPPADSLNLQMAKKISETKNSIALHVRWFIPPSINTRLGNLTKEYYKQAMDLISKKLGSAHYFVFSNNIKTAFSAFNIPQNKVTYIFHNIGDENAYGRFVAYDTL